MPNVLDIEPVRAFVRRAAAKIADAEVAVRFERLTVARLLVDRRNFRSATAADLECAPDWVSAAVDRGETISVFNLQRGAGQRVHNLARRLDATRQFAAIDMARTPHSATYIAAAREFIDKLDRADFETMRRKAYYFSRMLVFCSDTQDARRLCPDQALPLPDGRRWMRVTSVDELRAVGREFRNCLARTTRTGVYGGGLFRGERQFWVMRNANGAGRVVVMADAPQATKLMEVRGPRNSRVAPSDLDLMRLSRALGIPPPPPPPSPPPGAVLRLRDLPCQCADCAPPPVLRLLAAAP